MGQPYIDQDSFRWAQDTASRNWIEDPNTDLSDPSSWLDTNICLRFLLQNTGDKDLTDGYRLEYSINAGVDWNPVTTSSSYVRSYSSGNFTDDDSTSQELGSGTFDEGYWDDDGVTPSYTFAQTQESEHEFCFQFRSADVTGQTVLIRVARDDGSDLNLYTNTPSTTFTGGDISQPHFRIRSGDDQSLNADAGWAANLDTNATIDVHTLFRIRFEIESADNIGAKTYKLQWRKGAGSFADIVYYPNDAPDTATSFPSVIVGNSSQYAHSDDTTNVLSGSSLTFTTGDGVEGTNTTPSISLNNQHTEVEFPVRIHGLHFDDTGGDPAQNVDGDTFEFRLVEGDGTVFTGSYTNPTITLNVPAKYIGGCYVETPGRVGPFIDGNGNLYVLVETTHVGSDRNRPAMMKSTDGGDTWILQDTAGSPTEADTEAVDIYQDTTNHILHAVHQRSYRPHHYAYNTSDHGTPDDWSIIDEDIDQGFSSTTSEAAAVSKLSTGEVRAAYAADNSIQDIKANTRNGSWGTPIAIDDSGTTHYSGVVFALGASDLLHIFYKDHTNGVLYHKSLSSADSLSARESVDNDVGTASGTQNPTTEAIYWDDDGDEKIMIVYRDASDSYLYSAVITNDGSPESRKAASDHTVSDSESDSQAPCATLAIDGTKAWLIYADATNRYLYIVSNDNDGTWGAASLLDDSILPAWIRGRVFTHSGGNGGDKVFGYFYEDEPAVGYGYTGFIWYDEYVIQAGGASTTPAKMHQYRQRRVA